MRKKNRIVVMMVALALLGCASTVSFYYGVVLIEDKDIPMDVKVNDKIGFNTETDALHFGTVYQGGESRRQLIVGNTNEWPVTVTISNSGNISGFVRTDMSTFTLEANKNTTVLYTVSVPPRQPFGYYEGESRVIIKRAFFGR